MASSITLLEITEMVSELSFSTWNINGIHNNVLGDKTKNKDFLESISKIDFMFLTETWTNTSINIPGFETIASPTAKPLTNQAGRQSGGINLLFKSNFKKHVTITKNTKNFLWCKNLKRNPWFVTILRPISNLRNKLKILKLKPNLLVLALFH